MLEAAKDPGLPVLRFSIFLIVIGIPLSLVRIFFNIEKTDLSK
jgi:hypothetical protein